MRQRLAIQNHCWNPLLLFLLFVYLHESCCSSPIYLESSFVVERRADELFPEISPTDSPQPLLPLLAPSPLMPFSMNTVPKLSGKCNLNFSAIENMMTTTAIDCIASFAPVLANVVCCPQLEATLLILIGQSSKNTQYLALNETTSKNCLSDYQQILVSRGANNSLQHICSIHPLNLTEASCPVKHINDFEKTVDSSKLLLDCGKIDLVNECCQQVCQNAILDAAKKLALRGGYDMLKMEGDQHVLSEHSSRVNDCRSVVLRWLASKLNPTDAKDVLRGLSNCKTNTVCPLVFPETGHLTKSCGNELSDQTACCKAMESYVSHLQKQSFITNLQASDCAASLGKKLYRANITENVYKLCRISLKDFSLQVGTLGIESGCLLPSLPSDVILDKSTGVSFLCDLNDNLPAPWPSLSQLPASSCNKTIKIPALPAAASGQDGLYNRDVMESVLAVAFIVLTVFLL